MKIGRGISISQTLAGRALAKARENDLNFSRYVETLIKRDLDSADQTAEAQAVNFATSAETPKQEGGK